MGGSYEHFEGTREHGDCESR